MNDRPDEIVNSTSEAVPPQWALFFLLAAVVIVLAGALHLLFLAAG